MADSTRCPVCGADLSTNPLQGLCPRCLMRSALGDPLIDTDEATPIDVDDRTRAASGDERLDDPDPKSTTARERSEEARAGLQPATKVRYFGDYEILRELGRGGMGVVYEARQISLNRPVALKLIKAGALAEATELRRFQNEVEAVALLDHPGIVPVYEVGDFAGQKYFAMKLVIGANLAAGLDRYRNDFRASASLVQKAAEAIQHAHARGILHRDLKPANMMIDEGGDPHLTDFGLAKRVASDPELTVSGTILGTPAYMSPEQAEARRGGVTTASDVYGLGAILYALLTGRAPFGGESVFQTLDSVRSLAPEPPTRINAKVPADLETIALKCLEKDPRRRYASALALADDLRAWLGTRPISARRVGPVERAFLWCRRRPAIAGLSAALLLIGVLGVGGVIAVQAQANRRLVRKNEQLSAANRRVQQRYDLAVESIRTLHTGVSEDFLLKQDQFKQLRDRLLNSAIRYYEKLETLLDAESESDFASRQDLLDARFEVAELTARVGHVEDAIRAHRSILKARGAPDVEAGARRDERLAVSQNALGDLLATIGLSGEAESLYRDAIATNERLASRSPADERPRRLLADSHLKLGALLSKSGQAADAERHVREAVRLYEGLGNRPFAETSKRIAKSRNHLGIFLAARGDREQAATEYRRAIDLLTRVVTADPSDLSAADSLADVRNNFAVFLSHHGETSGADAEYREAIRIQTRLARENPGVLDFGNRLARSHINFGVLLWQTGRIKEAETEYRQARDVLVRLVADNPSVIEPRNLLASCQGKVGILMAQTGRIDEAERELGEAVTLQTELARSHPRAHDFRSRLGDNLCCLGNVYLQRGKRDEAEASYRRAIDVEQRLVDENPSHDDYLVSLSMSRFNLGSLLLQSNRPLDAEPEFRMAVSLQRSLYERNPKLASSRNGLASSLGALGSYLIGIGRLTEAESALRETITLLESQVADTPSVIEYRSDLASAHFALGTVLSRLSRLDEAELELRQASDDQDRLADANPKVTELRSSAVNDRIGLAHLLQKRGHSTESVEAFERALAEAEALVLAHPSISPYRAAPGFALRGRASVRIQLGDFDGARADLRRAVSVWDSLESPSNEHLIEAAATHALLASLDTSTRGTELEISLDRLRKAIASGFRDLLLLRDEPSFALLRDLESFRELVRDVAMPLDPFARTSP